MRGSIVLSIDFELRWGVQDVLGTDFARYRRNLEGVREVVPAMLDVFRRHGARATWAVVGALACESWDEWHERAPAWPRYLDPALEWTSTFQEGDPAGRLYFASDLVALVREAPGQELGSHTFSHAYFREPGFVRRDAEADAAATRTLFLDRWGEAPRSFVFPRNQIGYTDVLQTAGVHIWRDNPRPFFWSMDRAAERAGLFRPLRVADALMPLGTRVSSGDDAYRASHFVRFPLPDALWGLHVKRLVAEARRLQAGAVLHLWWHPHNLGADVARSIRRLDDLLDTLRDAAPEARFASMGDLVA